MSQEEISAGVKAVAQSFVERKEALGYKGAKCDAAAMDYFCGAATAAKIAGNQELSDALARNAVMIIAVRGFIGVSQIAAGKI